MQIILRMPDGSELRLELPHWDNEMVGVWLHKIFMALSNYPQGKRPQVPLQFQLTIQ